MAALARGSAGKGERGDPAHDALAAERRRQPMVEVSTEYRFDGPDGEVGLLDLFEGRFALVSTASQAQIEAYKRRMGWSIPWYTTIGTDFQEMRGTTEYFSLDVYLRDGDPWSRR